MNAFTKTELKLCLDLLTAEQQQAVAIEIAKTLKGEIEFVADHTIAINGATTDDNFVLTKGKVEGKALKIAVKDGNKALSKGFAMLHPDGKIRLFTFVAQNAFTYAQADVADAKTYKIVGSPNALNVDAAINLCAQYFGDNLAGHIVHNETNNTLEVGENAEIDGDLNVNGDTTLHNLYLKDTSDDKKGHIYYDEATKQIVIDPSGVESTPKLRIYRAANYLYLITDSGKKILINSPTAFSFDTVFSGPATFSNSVVHNQIVDFNAPISISAYNYAREATINRDITYEATENTEITADSAPNIHKNLGYPTKLTIKPSKSVTFKSIFIKVNNLNQDNVLTYSYDTTTGPLINTTLTNIGTSSASFILQFTSGTTAELIYLENA